jgi:cell division protein FtsL
MARAASAAARKPAAARSAPARKPARHAPAARKPGARRAAAVRKPQRRVSGPAAGARRPAFAGSGASAGLPLLQSPLARLARDRGGRILDALLAGRGWIVLVFILLAGIVFFNVDLLQLNREIAASTERAAELKRSNASLRVELARLGSSERIQELALEEGFYLPQPGEVLYRRASAGDAKRALGRLSEPQPVVLAPAPEPTTDETGATTDPAALDPTATDPAVTDPGVTDPALATPQATTDPATTAPPATTPPATTPAPAAGPTGAPTAPSG